MTNIVEYINSHLEDNDELVCKLLTRYIHSSYMYKKQNMDGSYLCCQPGWPEYNEVTGYRYYEDYDMRFNHKTGRLILVLDGKSETDVGIYKFKKFAKRVYGNNPT